MTSLPSASTPGAVAAEDHRQPVGRQPDALQRPDVVVVQPGRADRHRRPAGRVASGPDARRPPARSAGRSRRCGRRRRRASAHSRRTPIRRSTTLRRGAEAHQSSCANLRAVSLPGDLRIAAIVPCFNEEIAVGKVVSDLRAAVPGISVYVYDNNSTDRTAEVAREAGAIVRQESNKGKGNVVRRAFADVEADIYVMIDGDDTYDALATPRLIETLLDGPYDHVLGVRREVVTEAYRPGHASGNKAFNTIVSGIFDVTVRDMLSGFRAFSRRFVKSFPATAREFETETELTIHAANLQSPPGRGRGRLQGPPARGGQQAADLPGRLGHPEADRPSHPGRAANPVPLLAGRGHRDHRRHPRSPGRDRVPPDRSGPQAARPLSSPPRSSSLRSRSTSSGSSSARSSARRTRTCGWFTCRCSR